MKHTLFSLFVALGCGAFFCSCGAKTTEVIYNNGVPGTIIGNVTLYDSLFANGAVPIPLDPSGVEVSIEGTTLKAITHINGKCTISNVPPGVYNFLFKKEGFATQVSGRKEFAGNGTDLVDANMFRSSHKSVDLVLRDFDSAVAIFTWKILDSLKANEIVVGNIFFSENPGISPYDTSTYRYVFSPSTSQTTDNNIYVVKKTLLTYGFSDNQTIYCLLVPSNVYCGYSDPISGKTIFYDGLSPYNSGVKSFVLP